MPVDLMESRCVDDVTDLFEIHTLLLWHGRHTFKADPRLTTGDFVYGRAQNKVSYPQVLYN